MAEITTNNSQSEISAGQEEQAQATVEAGSTEQSSNVGPNYSQERKRELQELTTTCEQEIERVISDPAYHGQAYGGGTNVIMDIKAAVKDGIKLYTPLMNRQHGKDQSRTGESIEKYGAQHPLLVITTAMAEAADIEFTYFDGSEACDDSGLVVIDGNGRTSYLSTRDVDSWPDIYGIFPARDALGYYNLRQIYEEVNTNLKPWGTQDFVQKRMLQEGSLSHRGWSMVNELLRKGYLYQAACEAVTLATDRIKKGDILSGDSNDIFANFESAVKVHEALVRKFGEGDDKILKTKRIPMLVSKLWQGLQRKSGNEAATEKFVAFVEQLPDDVVKQMKEAKTTKTKTGKVSKDDRREEQFTQAFKKWSEPQTAKAK